MKIYVVTHKPIDIDLPADYELFQVGAAVNGAFCEHNDAVGEDNISAKNPNYCELTAAYWIWKNDHENDIVGLMHYRRFLTNAVFSKSDSFFIGSDDAEKLLTKYDFIVPKKLKLKTNAKLQMLQGNVREKDYLILRSTINRLYPDYIRTFDNVFSGRYTFMCNIFVTSKKEWDEYYTWLFSIFNEMEKEVNMDGYSIQEKRLYGFISERLLYVYILKNRKKVKYKRLLYPHDSFPVRVMKKLKKIFSRNND